MKEERDLHRAGPSGVSRRAFLKGAGAVAAVAATAALPLMTGCTKANAEFWVPEKWDKEVDTVVVGMGGGAIMAGITAYDKGDSVVLLEKAPKGKEGGNSRVCGQLMFCPTDVDGAVKYQTNINGLYQVDPDTLKAWATALVGLPKLLKGLGTDVIEYKGSLSPEFVGMGGEGIAKVYYIEKPSYSSGWNFLKANLDKRGVEVLYDTPGKRLIQDPQTKEILGIVAGKDGAEITIKARKGVLLACGGFENNQKMARDYLPNMPKVTPIGTPYNTGDGITMAQAVGADLWHMNSVSGPSLSFANPDLQCCTGPIMATKRYIWVNSSGERFVSEDMATGSKHGKIKIYGAYAPQPTPMPVYAIFDDVNFKATSIFWNGTDSVTWAGVVEKYKGSADNSAELAKGWIVKGSSLEELATKIKLDPAKLKKTLDTYNANAAQNADPEFGRGGPIEEVLTAGQGAYKLVPVTGPNYYAVELTASLINTQGGPRRNGKGQILDTTGTPIPRLYGAGECGTFYPYLYNGGGNFAETIAYGNVSALEINGLTRWDADEKK